MRVNNIFIIFSLLFVSCETLVDEVYMPDEKPELVVFCTLSPQQTDTYVILSFTEPLFGSHPDYTLLTQAKVSIFSSTDTAFLTFFDIYGYGNQNVYFSTDSSQLKVHAGQEYHLKVELPDGQTSLASCHVPQIPPQDVSIADFTRGSNPDFYYARLRIKFTDQAGKRNYYRVIFFEEYSPNPNEHYYNYDNGNIDRKEFFDDLYGGTNYDGQVMYSNIITIYNYVIYENKYWVRVLSCDENYYKYYTTAAMNGETFFTEPSIIYTNIENGTGFFGAIMYSDILITQLSNKQ